MPIYEYRCRACGYEFETLQKMSEPKLVECPVCKEPELVKKISAVSFRLKGGGWYETDFKSDNKRQLHDDGKSDSKSESNTKSDSKSDSAETSNSNASSTKESNSTKSATSPKSESTSSSTPSS